jgi:hypothetical protein
MPYKLKGVYSSVGSPTFETEKDLELAKELARRSPYNVRWDAWDGAFLPFLPQAEVTCFATYRRLYGDAPADLLEQMRLRGEGDGLLVVSYERKWAFPEAIFIDPDPVPQPVPGPDEEIVKTPWGDFIRKKAAKAGGLTTADVEQIAARVVRDTLKALGIIVA